MDWGVTDVKKFEEKLIVTAQVEIPISEFEDLISNKFSFAGKEIAKQVIEKTKKKPRKGKQGLSMTPRAVYQRNWQRKKAEEKTAKEKDEVSEEKMERMQKVQDGIDKVKEEQGKIYKNKENSKYKKERP